MRTKDRGGELPETQTWVHFLRP